MNIAEAERRTGLTRANIRFYEKEGLLKPTRGENGYRDYTEDNVQTLRKIMLLRRLRLLNHARRCPVRRGSAAFSVCAAPAENAVFVTLGKKSGKFQISSCQSGGSVVF